MFVSKTHGIDGLLDDRILVEAFSGLEVFAVGLNKMSSEWIFK
jgi:hypothetical protein